MKKIDIIRQLIKPYFLSYYALPFLGILALITGLLTPLVQKNLIDNIQNDNKVWWYLLLAIGCFGVTTTISGVIRYIDERLKAHILKNFKSFLIGKIFDLPCDFFHQHGSGYLTARIEFDSARMGYFYSNLRWQLWLSILSIIGAYIALALVNWQMAIIFAAILPIYLILVNKFRKENYKISKESSEVRSLAYNSLRCVFGNIRTVKVLASEDVAKEDVVKKYDSVLNLNLVQIRLHTLLNCSVRGIPLLFKGGILIFGVIQIRNHNWSLGEVWALLSYCGLIFAPVITLVGLILEREVAKSAFDRIMELLKRFPEENLQDGLAPTKLRGAIELRNIFFGYCDDRMIINNLSYKVNPQDKVAIIGKSGSGKTTLMSLILLLYKVQSGEILFDNIPIADYNLRLLRKKIGYVCQSPQFFSGTLMENLGSEVSFGAAKTTLELVGATELIERLHEEISEDGENFSTGERLRIALARELLRNPDIIILDEPTANLDAEKEHEIMRIFSGALCDKTVFLVTHKNELLKYCNKVISL